MWSGEPSVPLGAGLVVDREDADAKIRDTAEIEQLGHVHRMAGADQRT